MNESRFTGMVFAALALNLPLVSGAQLPARMLPPRQSATTQAVDPSKSSPAVTPQPPALPAPSAKPNAEAIMLLQRAQQLLSREQTPDHFDRKSAGKVTMERADVDEILADIEEVKVMLQTRGDQATTTARFP
jgi:hypothetical protein